MLRKVISIFTAAVVALSCLTSCKSSYQLKEYPAPLRIVATIFPQYDMARNILGDTPARAGLQLLIGNGVDMHSYQPTVRDIASISECDVFIYVGGESDSWVEDALTASETQPKYIVNLMDVLSDAALEEETVEGMEVHEEGEEEEGPEYDEHVWLSLRNAQVICEAIRDALKQADPDNSDLYDSNCADYCASLAELDGRYEEAVEQADLDTILVADRFPFRYLAEDYGLNYYAAFAGCSAETEASFDTITFLAGKVDELQLPCIITMEGSDGRIAATVADNTSFPQIPVLTMDSMQSVTMEDIQGGKTYLQIMEDNLEVLTQALTAR